MRGCCAFEEALGTKMIVPSVHELMGAFGAAPLALDTVDGRQTAFRGFSSAEIEYRTASFECHARPNVCEIAETRMGSEVTARWGGRCGS